MSGGNVYVIRLATHEDQGNLRELAQLDSKRPLTGRTLVGEIDGRPAAALSLSDGRVAADPFQATSHLVSQLRLRASGLNAYQRTPSLADRVRAVVRVRQTDSPAQA